jgi:hypothetical protein
MGGYESLRKNTGGNEAGDKSILPGSMGDPQSTRQGS